jgi:O-antigen/teichoic acid export membrane protein
VAVQQQIESTPGSDRAPGRGEAAHAGLNGAAQSRRRGSVARLASASYFAVALGFVTSPIVARVLGPTDRGHYAAIYTFAVVLELVLSLGIPVAITYQLVNRLELPERLIGTALRFCLALLAPAVAIAIALTAGVLDLPAGAVTYLAIIALALAPCGVLALCLQGFLTSSGALDSLAWLRMAPLVANFAGVVALAAVGRLTLTSYVALTVAISLFSLLLAWRFVGVRPRGRARFRSLLGFGLRSYPGSFAKLLNFRVDQVILVPLVSPAQLAFYAIAVTISQLPQSMADAIGTRTLGSVIDPQGSFQTQRAERYMRLSLLTAVIACAAVAVSAPLFVPLLYGNSFEGIVTPLLLLLPGAIANAGTGVANPCLTAIGRPGVTSIAEITAVAITAGGLWYALPRYGIAGAAAVSSVAYLYRYGVQIAILRRTGVRRFVPRWADATELARAIPRPRADGG